MRKSYLMMLTAIFFLLSASAHAVDFAGVEIHGFISQGFLLSGDNNYFSAKTSDGSFQFNELGINFSKELTDNLRMGIQLFSRDLGRAGNNAVVVDWAHGDYRFKDWLGIRAGLLKMPHGFYNDTRDQDMVRTSILLPQSVYPEIQRDNYARFWGGEVYGSIYIQAAGSFSYKLSVGSFKPDEDNSGVALTVVDGRPWNLEEFKSATQYNGSLIWETPLDGLRIGATGWFMENVGTTLRFPYGLGPNVPAGAEATTDVERWSTVFSIEYTWNDFKIYGEYLFEHDDIGWENAALGLPNREFDSEGYYIGASYRFTEWFELGSYYSEFFPDKDDKDGDKISASGSNDFEAWQKDLALSTRFDINEYWLVKLEGHYMNGTAGWALIDDNSGGFKQHDFLFAAKATFNF